MNAYYTISKKTLLFLTFSMIALSRRCNAIKHLDTYTALLLPSTCKQSLISSNSRTLRNYRLVPARKRRGFIRSQMHGRDEPLTTQYTINDGICPPTNTTLLQNTVQKHIDTLSKYLNSKPISGYNLEAFGEALKFVDEFSLINFGTNSSEKVKVILDSGCGTGRSTKLLAARFPECAVIGIDRSFVRLNKNREYRKKVNEPNDKDTIRGETQQKNILLLRADLIDFWHLCLTSVEWQTKVYVQKHYLLYPNPYPKKSRLKSRFYAHPAFPLLMLTIMNVSCDGMIVRSNWKGYLDEFALAVRVWEGAELSLDHFKDLDFDVSTYVHKLRWEIRSPERIRSDSMAMTNFEAKYFSCGEPVYELYIRTTKL